LFLRAAGVHAMQGYRFGRPVPADQVADFNLPELDRPFERFAVAR
jgi:EAL domain-containing protein (putative c-di-GMP-specific phosphodiesterase class I)